MLQKNWTPSAGILMLTIKKTLKKNVSLHLKPSQNLHRSTIRLPPNLGILANLGPVQCRFWALYEFLTFNFERLINPAPAQESRWIKCTRPAQAQDLQESLDFGELSCKPLKKFQKILGFLGILGLCMCCALYPPGLGNGGLCPGFFQFK